nr:probable protein phosphatase 2C 51 isoform X1 [Ipomoea batatas]
MFCSSASKAAALLSSFRIRFGHVSKAIEGGGDGGRPWMDCEVENGGQAVKNVDRPVEAEVGLKALKEGNSQFATLEDVKKYQEIRVICYPNVTIPVLDVSVAVGAVFDSHGGKEASKMTSEKFLDYFFLHVVFNTYRKVFLHKKDNK